MSLYSVGTFGGSASFLEDGGANTGTDDEMLPVLLLRSLNDAALPYDSSRELSEEKKISDSYEMNLLNQLKAKNYGRFQ